MSTATVKIGADISPFQAKLKEALGSMGGFAKSVASVAGGQALFAGVGFGLDVVRKGLESIKEGFQTAFEAAGEFESITARFQTFYRSVETTNAAVASLTKYAATTAFQLAEVADAGTRLAAAGVPADQLGESIRVIGDIAAATQKPLADILLPYTKVLSVGKMQTESFLMFLERGIPIANELKAALNMSDSQLAEAMSKGKISAQDTVNALQKLTTTGLFAGGAANQGKTLNGLMSTLKDSIEEVYRNAGLAASVGFKMLIDKAQTLYSKLAPIGVVLGNAFTQAVQRALDFSDGFMSAFDKAVAYALDAFKILEGAIKNGTLWEILKVNAQIAFKEVELFGVQALQGVSSALESDAFVASAEAFWDAFKKKSQEIPQAFADAMEVPLVRAFGRATDSLFTGVKRSFLKIADDPVFAAATTGGAFMVNPALGMAVGAAHLNRAHERSFPDIPIDENGRRYDEPYASGYFGEALAAKAAGYRTPLRPSEVKETFIKGIRSTYNTRETLDDGMILPPAYAGGSIGNAVSGLVEAFKQGTKEQTAETKKVSAEITSLRMKLVDIQAEARKASTKIEEQTKTLKENKKLTAKTPEADAKKEKEKEDKQAKVKVDSDRFTSLQKIGGGFRKMNLSARPAVEGEGLLPASLKPAGDLGGGFKSSPRFIAAREFQRTKPDIAAFEARFRGRQLAQDRAMGLGGALNVPPAKLNPPNIGVQPPMPAGFSSDQAIKLLERLIAIGERSLSVQTRTLDMPVV